VATTAQPERARQGSRRRRARDRWRGDRGSTSVELAVLFPVMLLVITALIQYALWFHARSVALAAAQEGVTAARVYTADPAAGLERARTFIDTHADGVLTDVAVTATNPGPDQVGVEVTGRSLSLLPGVPGLLVTQSAEGPVERFTVAGTP